MGWRRGKRRRRRRRGKKKEASYGIDNFRLTDKSCHTLGTILYIVKKSDQPNKLLKCAKVPVFSFPSNLHTLSLLTADLVGRQWMHKTEDKIPAVRREGEGNNLIKEIEFKFHRK